MGGAALGSRLILALTCALTSALLAATPTTDQSGTAAPLRHYYCTASDEKYFALLLNLIGSIHHIDYQNLGEIAVFDLGLTPEQVAQLQRIVGVRVLTVVPKNPELLTPFTTRPDGTQARGWYSWKPVIIYQYLQEQDCFLYLDAGMTVMQRPVALFEYLRQKGYFLTSANHSFAGRITVPVQNWLRQNFTAVQIAQLEQPQIGMLSAGLLGVTKRIQASLIQPVYDLVRTDSLALFADDGSAPAGFGAARHDQTLFSIYAHLNGLRITGANKVIFVKMPPGPQQPFNSFCIGGNSATIFKSRWDLHAAGDQARYIKYHCT